MRPGHRGHRSQEPLSARGKDNEKIRQLWRAPSAVCTLAMLLFSPLFSFADECHAGFTPRRVDQLAAALIQEARTARQTERCKLLGEEPYRITACCPPVWNPTAISSELTAKLEELARALFPGSKNTGAKVAASTALVSQVITDTQTSSQIYSLSLTSDNSRANDPLFFAKDPIALARSRPNRRATRSGSAGFVAEVDPWVQPAGRETRKVYGSGNHELRLGGSIGHDRNKAGTLGCLLSNGTDLFALSNRHVLNGLGDDLVYQPGRRKRRTDAIGTLVLANQDLDDQQVNLFDAALVRLAPESFELQLPVDGDGGPSATISPAALFPDPLACEHLKQAVTEALIRVFQSGVLNRNLLVAKYGKTTGYTRGKIACTGATVWVRSDTMTYRFDDQLIIESAALAPLANGRTTTPFCASGDSGSLVVLDSSYGRLGGLPVGLLSATIPNVTLRPNDKNSPVVSACIASPISGVLEGLVTPETGELRICNGNMDNCPWTR